MSPTPSATGPASPLATAPPFPGDAMVPVAARVRARRQETSDIFTLDIEPCQSLPFQPGQFNMLTVFGVGEAAISVSGDPTDANRLIHTIRDVGAVSAALTRLEAGSMVGVRGPFGVGWPVREAHGRDVVIVAGGLGLAPLRPALYALFAERPRFGRVTLLVGARSPADIPFRDEIDHWRRRLDIGIEVTVDHADPDWNGNVGVVTTLMKHIELDPSRTLAMVCGPEVMMRFAIAALSDAGVAPDDIYLSMERSMKCAVAFCGHCQFGPVFVCRDGPVFPWQRIRHLLTLKEI